MKKELFISNRNSRKRDRLQCWGTSFVGQTGHTLFSSVGVTNLPSDVRDIVIEQERILIESIACSNTATCVVYKIHRIQNNGTFMKCSGATPYGMNGLAGVGSQSNNFLTAKRFQPAIW